MRFNGDANSGHYQSYEGYLGGNNPDVESTAGIIGYGPASTSPAGESLRGEIVIPMYASTSFDHGYHMVGTMDYAGYHRLMLAGGVWLTTGAITEITLFADNGNLVPGSMASLYGMN
jgi:hypothetical protein